MAKDSAVLTRGSKRNAPAPLLSCGTVQVGGESIYYEATGAAEHGPTLLFLHESGGTSATWHGQLTGLAKGAHCLAPDLPGHGRSEGIGHRTVAGYRQAVLAFLDALAIRWPVVVAGVCLGAAIATDLAIHAPHRVAALVLGGVAENGRACPRTLEEAARGEVTDSFVQELFGTEPSQRLLRDRAQRWHSTSPVVRHGDLAAMAGYPLLTALLGVTHPTLLVAGEQDRIAPPELARDVAAAMHGARAVGVAGAGCLAMGEQPVAFNRQVTDFIGRLAPASPIEPEPLGRGGYRRF